MSLDVNAVANTPTQFTISNAESRPDARAVQEIVNASNALNPQDGVTFGPFTVKYMSGAFENVWNSADYKHGTPITFYQSNGAGGTFLPLGDVALIGQTLNPDPLPGQQLLFAPSPSDPSALQHGPRSSGPGASRSSGTWCSLSACLS